MVNVVACTIFENDYHLGVAGLVNSLYHAGFRGRVFAAYRGDLPVWATSASDGVFNAANDLDIIFYKTRYTSHLTTYKPTFMLDIFKLDERIEGVLYFDPDIVALVQWSFFCDWIRYGVALCSDSHRYMMHASHPIKQKWKTELGSLFPRWRDFYGYANAGFVGISRDNIAFLSAWKTVIDHMQLNTMNLNLIKIHDPTHPFHNQDQDALNAAIHLCDVPISLAGQEEMGFFHAMPYMAHALGPKPWRKSFVREALRGRRPSFAAKQYWRYVENPIRVFSPLQIRTVGLEILLARFIAGIRG